MFLKKSNLYPILFLFAAAILSACTSAPIQVIGKTMASPALQERIISKLRPQMNLETGCPNLESIDASIKKVERNQNNRINAVNEIWVVQGCGITVSYPVRLSKNVLGQSTFEIGPSF